MDRMQLKAMAKINLGLDVLRRREDGYHEVRMVMQTVHIFDQLQLEKRREEGIFVRTNLYYLPENENNLVYKAAKILREEFPEFAPKLFMLENITSSAALKRRAEEFFPEEYQDGQTTLLSIGRLVQLKGFDMAIKAAALLKKEGLVFRWFVIGTGGLKEELIRQIEDEQVSDCFILLGARENPYPYIENCTIFVQTSRYEGKSVALDEAKILAKPIVVTAYPTVGDQIINGDEGLITELSPESIASGIREMLEKRALREHISGFLSAHEYGNQDEVKKYIQVIEGTS